MARPTKYTPDMCDRLIAFGKEGMGRAEMAAELEIDRATLSAWMDEKPEFSRAVKAALDHSQAWWEKNGRIATFSDVPFNATSFIFNMKNRFKEDWSDRTQTEHTGKDGGPIETSDVSPRDKLAAMMDSNAKRLAASSITPDE